MRNPSEVDWIEAHAFGPQGWSAEQFETLPEAERRAIAERHELRRLARETLDPRERAALRARREELEYNLKGDPAVLSLLMQAREQIFLVAREHLVATWLSLKEIRDMLLVSGYLEEQLPPEFVEEVQIVALQQVLFEVNLALEEAWMNHYKHGVQGDPREPVSGKARVCEDVYETESWDGGHGFNPEDVRDPTDPDNLERPCGRGLLLMRHYMNLEILDGGRRFRMSRNLARKPDSQRIIVTAAKIVAQAKSETNGNQ